MSGSVHDSKIENWSRDDVVGIGTRLWAGLSGILFPARSDRLWGPSSLLNRCREFLPRKNGRGNGAEHSAPLPPPSLLGRNPLHLFKRLGGPQSRSDRAGNRIPDSPAHSLVPIPTTSSWLQFSVLLPLTI